MSKTAVLFISHIVDDEIKFRYNHLKTGCDKMGYDLFWLVDETKVDITKLDKKINFYGFSYEKYDTEIPFVIYGTTKDEHLNSACGATLLFANDNEQYKYIWVVEYDVCMMGEWENFFKKYQNSEADIITKNLTHTDKLEHWNKWGFYRKVDHQLMDVINEKGKLARSLNCLCRISRRLVDSIFTFLEGFDDRNIYYEWSWVTVAYLFDYEVQQFQSNRFFCSKVPEDFTDFKVDTPYHAIKANVKWKDYMDKYLQKSKVKARKK